MKYRLLYENAEGRLQIVVPDPKFQQPREDDATCVARLYANALPGITEFIVCLPEDIPQDTTFREAWKKGDKYEPIKVDFIKAISIHRKRLQEACERKIKQLDADLERAKLKSNLPEQVAIKRTQEILATLHEMNLTHCKKIDDIKNAVPKELYDVWNYYPIG